jgi:ubiquinone/menaquinone biosynthesis C-methylase UbiE
MSDARPDGAGARASKSAVAYFDSHAGYYESSQYRTGRRTFVNGRHDQIVHLLAELHVPGASRVLDAGCGPGNLVPEFARRYGRVFAMDMSPRMLAIAGSNAASFDNVEYQVGSIESLPFADNSFDLVCSAGVIEYLPDCWPAVTELRRVLRPGGLLILPTTNALAPAHWLRRLLEPIGRIPAVARAFGLRPGNYRLWYHAIPRFRRRLLAAGFSLERERHFYLTLPRPLDRVFPNLAGRIERRFDRSMNTGLRHLAEGYIAVARKPPEAARKQGVEG